MVRLEPKALTANGILSLTNTIVAGSSPNDCVLGSGSVMTDGGHNLEDSTASLCGLFTRVIAIDPVCDIGAFEVQRVAVPVPTTGGATPAAPALALTAAGLALVGLTRRRRRR